MTGCAFLLPLVPVSLAFLGRCLARGGSECHCDKWGDSRRMSCGQDVSLLAQRNPTQSVSNPIQWKLTPVCVAFKCWNTFMHPPATWYALSEIPCQLFICRNNIFLSDQRWGGGGERWKSGGVVPAIFIIFFLRCLPLDKLNKLAGSWRVDLWPAGGICICPCPMGVSQICLYFRHLFFFFFNNSVSL